MIYEFLGKRPQIDETAYISDSATIIGDVIIGKNCYIGPQAVIRGDIAQIVLGDECAVEDGVIIHCSGGEFGDTIIGNRVTFGHGAIIHSRLIEDNACVGMGAVVSVGSTLREYAIVGEAALVKQYSEVPSRVVVGGVPCKFIRALEDRDIVSWEATKDHYVAIAKLSMDERNFRRID